MRSGWGTRPARPRISLAQGAVSREAVLGSLCEDDLQAKLIAPYLDVCVSVGVRAGVPDLTLVFDSCDYRPLVAMVELKAGRNTPDLEQKVILGLLTRVGVKSGVVKSVEGLRCFMEDCLKLWARRDLLAKLPEVM